MPSTVFAETAHRYEVPYDATQSGLAALESSALLSVGLRRRRWCG